MMDIPPIGIVILLASAGLSFFGGRYLSRGWRERKAKREQAVREASQSRQVRRAGQRRARR